MRYYIYLLQIFGGGNPKIHEIIRACGSAKRVYEMVSKGNMALIPSNRVENARKASLDISDQIIKFCKDNKIHIVTIDDKAYPTMLKNIYNPPTVLFVEGDISCLKNNFCLSVVGPRKPDTYAIRLATNICGGLAGCKTMLVSGFAYGIDSIAHAECIKRNVPTVAVLACGHTVEYPAHSFGIRTQVKKAGGAVISELLPDTPCCSGYFKFRNRIISGLTYGTVVIGAENRSGSLLTANNAFDQDRDLFFTMPPDTLDAKYSRIIRYLRDGAHPVYDFYDIINEYYEMHKERLDDTYLDKNRLSSYSTFSRISEDEDFDVVDEALGNDKVDEMGEPEPDVSVTHAESRKNEASERDVLKEIVDKNTLASEDVIKSTPSDKEIELTEATRKKARHRKEKKIVPPEKRFIYKAKNKGTPSVDYLSGTPDQFQKKGKKASNKAKTSEEILEDKVTENEQATTLVARILDIIEKEEAVTRERLMVLLGVNFTTITEYLADLEVDGAIVYHPGGVYTLGEEF